MMEYPSDEQVEYKGEEETDDPQEGEQRDDDPQEDEEEDDPQEEEMPDDDGFPAHSPAHSTHSAEPDSLIHQLEPFLEYHL